MSELSSWPARSTAILDDTPAKFELLHGHHSRPVTLPTTVTMFCHQLREVLTKIALDHPNEPRYLLNIDPQGAEFAACFQALDGWNPRTDSLPKTKVALVLLFITSPSLGALLIQVRSSVPNASSKLSFARAFPQMSVYEDWEESIGSLRLLRDWTARGMGDVSPSSSVDLVSFVLCVEVCLCPLAFRSPLRRSASSRSRGTSSSAQRRTC